MTIADKKVPPKPGQGKTRLLTEDEIYGPVNAILGNFILWRIKEMIGSPDAADFGDLLLKECEGGTHV